MAGIGWFKVSDDGVSGALREHKGHHWTFRIGRGSRIADVHRTNERTGEHGTLWVGRTRELLDWAERAFTPEAALALVRSVIRPIPARWLEEEGLWLFRSPMLPEAVRAAVMEELSQRPPDEYSDVLAPYASPPLPAGLVIPHLSGDIGQTLVAFDAPSRGSALRGVAVWSPHVLEPWRLLWLDIDGAADRVREAVAPYLDDLKAMDREEVWAGLTEWLQPRGFAAPTPWTARSRTFVWAGQRTAARGRLRRSR